jgi:PPOX class probable FMN-dependent enzyme
MENLSEYKSIDSDNQLREKYGEPSQMAVAVTKDHLDKHHINFIQNSPFVCLATSSDDGQPNVSPKGDAPGFVYIKDSHTLVIPDRPGNNKIESFQNLVKNPKIALIFLIPGINETVRVHGEAKIVDQEEILQLGIVGKKLPPAAIVVHVTRAYMHCGKAMIRSKLWSPESHIDEGVITPFGQVIKEQAKLPVDVDEVNQKINHVYKEELY